MLPKEQVIRFSSIERLLCDRKGAYQVRKIIEMILKKTNDLIVFDLTGVSVLTPEFARSGFGTLVKQVGIQTLRNRIRFLNQNEMINDILKKTMARAILESYPC